MRNFVIALAFLCLSLKSFAAGAPRCESVLVNDNFWSDRVISFNASARLSKEKQISVNNPAWVKGLFPGEPANTPYAKLYIRNMTLAGQYFIEQFIKNDIKNFDAFVVLQTEQHRIAMLGKNPNRPYGGEGGGVDAMVDSMVRSGAGTRKEVKEMLIEEAQDMAGTFRAQGSIHLMLGKYFNHESSPERRKEILAIHEKQIKIRDVLPEEQPLNEFTEWDWRHIYPDSDSLPVYLKSMHRSLNKIKSCVNCTRHEVLENLAEYYHTAINAHLFERVNHSVLMTQLNGILLHMGLEPMSHTITRPAVMRVDLAALIMSSEKFKTYFVNEIEKQVR